MTRKYSNSKRPLLLHRQQIIEHWLELKAQGIDDKTLQAVLKISRATFFRWHREYKSHGDSYHPENGAAFNCVRNYTVRQRRY